eukprot:17810-Rhodomonas_salina.1
MDYDFISFLNGRAHRIFDSELENPPLDSAYFAEISFVWDDRLKSAIAGSPVLEDSVRVSAQFLRGTYNPCTQNDLQNDLHGPDSDYFIQFIPFTQQTCAPSFWKDGPEAPATCPQVTIEGDHFSRIYIPLLDPPDVSPSEVKLSFDVFLGDMGGRNDTMSVDMVLVVDDFVTHCDSDSGSVDLAQLVTPRII